MHSFISWWWLFCQSLSLSSTQHTAGHCDVLLFSLHVIVVDPKAWLTPRQVYTETEILSCETVPPSILCLLINIISLFSAWQKTYPTPTNSTDSEQTIVFKANPPLSWDQCQFRTTTQFDYCGFVLDIIQNTILITTSWSGSCQKREKNTKILLLQQSPLELSFLLMLFSSVTKEKVQLNKLCHI